MTDSAVLGIDIGTSSSKAVLVSPDGRVIGTAVREHVVDRPHPGYVEMDAAVWWDELAGLTRELLGKHDVRVGAVGVSGMGPCVLVADEHGNPLLPAILYGVDTRAVTEIAALTDRYGADAIVARCGSALSSQAVGPKLAWLAANEPDAYAVAANLFMPSSWLVHRLTGEYVLDHHSASQSTPLYDIDAAEWYAPWWDDIAPQIDRPRLLWSGETAGTVTPAAAEATGLPAGIPVVAGTIDAWAEAVSVDAHRAGDLMLMYGSTMFLVNTVDVPLRAPALWTTAGAYPGRPCLAGGMATSGAVTSWLRDLFGDPDYEDLLAGAAASGPGARGLLMLPYFAGERTPVADPDARGLIAGLTLSHARGDLYRAALEATALGVRHNVEAMERAGSEINRIVAVGGGTKGGLWPQIVADVLGRAQDVPARTIGACYGSAYLAACAIDAPSIADWNPVAETVEPDRHNAPLYDELYSHYLALYPATADVSHALAELQRTTTTRSAAGAQKGSS